MGDVVLKAVEKSFGDVKVVCGVDLHIASGEFLVLVGASGCGKSTLLRMLAGLETPTAGDIFMDGKRVNDVKPQGRDIAMVFQSYALYPHMTVRENMAFGLKVRKEAKAVIDEKVNAAAEMLGLEPLLDRLPKEMSGGQRQRVAMGRAIVRRPQVFLFDEPLSNLDASLRAEMRVELRRLHQKLGVTMVYVTHDQVEAMTMADRIALLHEGVVQHVGRPAELYDWPANKYTAAFLGSPPMNFIDGTVHGGVASAQGVRLPYNTARFNVADGTRVIVGVRPHDMHVDLEAGLGTIEGAVEVVEPMGWEAHVHVKSPVFDGIARVEASELSAVPIGETRSFAVRADDVRLFEATTELSLALPSEA
ncbi:MAG: ABC-type sugar transport system ATPase subunit [Bradymonadia bacterium]|jgi:ABC-type sugar transport system ATPase subunit